MNLFDKNVVIEAAAATAVLAFGGVFVIMGVGALNGVSISLNQSVGMSGMFVFTRFIGLYAVRYIFKHLGK